MAAFADPSVRGIVASIGGEDSMRLLPHLDPDVVRRNPKVLMGYSDTTTLLTWGAQLGLVTFHGPAVMAGFAQLPHLPQEVTAQLRAVLFDGAAEVPLRPLPAYCEGYPDWGTPGLEGRLNPLQPSPPWKVVQGRGTVRGELFGGCIEVLEFLKGTRWWPAPDFWDGKVLFLETSEEIPPPQRVRRMLRNYGLQGVFERVAAVLFGRPRGYTAAQRAELHAMLAGVVGGEFGRPDLPVLADLDFGHTDPQWVLPLGVPVAVDCERPAAWLCGPAVE